MNKLISALSLGVVGLVILAAAAPTIVCLSNAVIPLIVVIGVVAIVLRLAWFHTRDW